MRQITKDAVAHFNAGVAFRRDNTEVEPGAQYTYMYLHGNMIAKRRGSGLWVRDAGWQTVTTKERLNGLLQQYGAGIHQKNGEWFLTVRDPLKGAAATLPWDSVADENGWVRIGGAE